MTDYRLYLLGQTGRFENVQALDCADDVTAIETAEQRRSGAAAELWQRGRRVRTFDGVALWTRHPSARGGAVEAAKHAPRTATDLDQVPEQTRRE